MSSNANPPAASRPELDRFRLLRIVVDKLLEDGRVDMAEKELFARFREKFEISEKKCSEVLREALDARKAAGASNSPAASPSGDAREYKRSLYSSVLYETLAGGPVTEKENELIAGISSVLAVPEDLESECVDSVHERLIGEAREAAAKDDFRGALETLAAFRPEKKNRYAYYATAYTAMREKHAGAGRVIRDGGAHDEFEALFAARSGREGGCFERLFFSAKLLPPADAVTRVGRLLELAEAAETDRQRSALYFELGISMQRIGKFEAAVKYYRKAVEADPADADAATNLVSAFISLKKFSEAAETASKCPAILEKDSRLNNNYAIALEKLEKHPEAAERFRAAIKLAPDHTDARVNLVSLLVKTRRTDDAAAELAELERRSPADPDIKKLRAAVEKLRNSH